MSDDLEKQLERYRELARIHERIDYGDSSSIGRANNAADEMARIYRAVSAEASGLDSFIKLLDEPTAKIQLWAAHHLLEHAHLSESMETKALEIIKLYSQGDDPDAYGEQLWLKDWESKRNQ